MAKVSENALKNWFAINGHKHFCSNRECRRVYQCLDVVFLNRCKHPNKNQLCGPCKGGAEPDLDVALPHLCCTNNVRQITDRDELKAYRLAGSGPWFKCKTCARCSGWPQGFANNS